MTSFADLYRGGAISEYLDVRYYGDTAELQAAVGDFVTKTLDVEVPDHRGRSPEQAFVLLNLYDKGNVPGFDVGKLDLDCAQLLTPYRGGSSGALGLNSFMRDTALPPQAACRTNADRTPTPPVCPENR